MERRDFLGATAAGAAAIASGCGAAAVERPERTASRSEVAAIHRRLDHGLAVVQQWQFLEHTLAARGATGPSARAYARDHEDAARAGLRALFVVGIYRDLPSDLGRDESLRDRLQGFSPELDRTAVSLASTMADTSPTRRDEIRRTLRRHRDVPADIGGRLDRYARSLSVEQRTRINMRSTVAQVAWRMSNQSPSFVMDEYVSKVHRIAGWQGPQAAVQRQIVAAMAAQAATDPRWGEPPAGATATVVTPTMPPGEEPTRPGTGVIRAGLIVGGVGLAVFGLGALIAATASDGTGGAILATLGAVGVLVGLIILLVGGIISASAGDDPREW